MLFKAMILVCAVVSSAGDEQCVMFSDEWGPYATKENCTIRVNQMGEEIYQALSPSIEISSMNGACIPEEGELS